MAARKTPASGGANKAAPRLKNYASEASEASIFEAIRATLAGP